MDREEKELVPDGVILVRRAARLGTGCGHDDRFNLDTVHALRRDDEGCEETEASSVDVALVFSNDDLGAVVVGVNEWTYTSEPAALFESFDREVRVSRTPRPPRSGRGFQVRLARGGNPQRDPLRGRSRRLGKRRESRAAAEGRCEKTENDDRPCSHRGCQPLNCGRAWYTPKSARVEDRFARASVCSVSKGAPESRALAGLFRRVYPGVCSLWKPPTTRLRLTIVEVATYAGA